MGRQRSVSMFRQVLMVIAGLVSVLACTLGRRGPRAAGVIGRAAGRQPDRAARARAHAANLAAFACWAGIALVVARSSSSSSRALVPSPAIRRASALAKK